MIFMPADKDEDKYSVVLDACVLVPISLCDLLLRLAEEPSTYRPFWSEQILAETAKSLRTKIGLSAAKVQWRLDQINAAFPIATISVMPEFLKAVDCIPDKDDRHVLAAAILARADMIVTENLRHFPKPCLDKFHVRSQSADDFLIEQFHLFPELMLDKLDDQAIGIAQDRKFILNSLGKVVPEFARLVESNEKPTKLR
jgi:predicted nucleic acid-binding protein